jgi:hypothetical protein
VLGSVAVAEGKRPPDGRLRHQGNAAVRDQWQSGTYAGHPLYTYSADSGPGKTSYVGAKQFGGTWYAINASGGTVKF